MPYPYDSQTPDYSQYFTNPDLAPAGYQWDSGTNAWANTPGYDPNAATTDTTNTNTNTDTTDTTDTTETTDPGPQNVFDSSNFDPERYNEGGVEESYQQQVEDGTRDPLDLQAARIIDRDSGSWEQALREYADEVGGLYQNEVEDVIRWVSYGENMGKDPITALNEAKGKILRGVGGRSGEGDGSDNIPGQPYNPNAESGNNGNSSNYGYDESSGQYGDTGGQGNFGQNSFNSYQDLLVQMMEEGRTRRESIAAQEAADSARRNELYNTYLGRSQEGLNFDATDPIIRNQVDAFRAEQTRGSRDYLSDLAERGGQYANLGGNRRIAAETAGTNTATFQAQLMANELTSRRGEAVDALNSMRGMLTADQQANLQREVDNYDNQLAQLNTGLGYQNLALQGDLGNRRLDQQQFGLESENDRYFNDFALRLAQQQFYQDYVNSTGYAPGA